jgi:hypothetical protein
MEPVHVPSAYICGGPPTYLVRSPVVEQREPTSDASIELCPKDGGVGTVYQRYFHYMLGNNVEPELLAITRRKIVRGEMHLHRRPGSWGAHT